MRGLAILVAVGAALPILPAQAADLTPVSVVLPQCAPDSPVGPDRVLGCSYIALPGKDGKTYFGYLTSPGDVRWNGTSSAGSLTFPASGQQWPRLSLFSGIGSATVTPAEVTGSLTATSDVSLQVAFSARIEVFGTSCTAVGSLPLSSTTTDTIGGGQGRGRDAAGSFAVAGTSTAAPNLTGGACAEAAKYVDLSRGVGMYLDGVMTSGGTQSGGSLGAQTAALTTAPMIKRKGRTVLLKKAVQTNAGQVATVSVTWSPRKSARGASARYASLSSRPSGRVILSTTGKAKRLYVRMTVSAPPTGSFEEYLQTRRWVVR